MRSFPVGGKTHCALIAAHANDVQNKNETQRGDAKELDIVNSENKFAVRWITSFCLSTRIESTWKNNESWGWRSQTLLKFEQENMRPWLAEFQEILSSQARPYLYIGRSRIYSHLRGESCLGQEKELTFSKRNHSVLYSTELNFFK